MMGWLLLVLLCGSGGEGAYVSGACVVVGVGCHSSRCSVDMRRLLGAALSRRAATSISVSGTAALHLSVVWVGRA